jgi:hypothetical protein
LAPTLRVVDLSYQKYYHNGNKVLQSLCNGILESLGLHGAFLGTTTLPPCFWRETNMVTFGFSRPHDYEEKYISKVLKTKLYQQSKLNGSFPSFGLSMMKQLSRFECCDAQHGPASRDYADDLFLDKSKQTIKTDVAVINPNLIHPLHGELPILPLSITNFQLLATSVNGSIPKQWCQLTKLIRLKLLALPMLRSTLPPCLGNVTGLIYIELNQLIGLTGEIPWFDQYGYNGWINLVNTRSFGSLGQIQNTDINIHETNLVGQALPVVFPVQCTLKTITLSNNPHLGGILSPSIRNCPLIKIQIESSGGRHGNFTGDLPQSICSICTLEKLRIEGPNGFNNASIKWFHNHCNVTQHVELCKSNNKSVPYVILESIRKNGLEKFQQDNWLCK